MENEKLLVYESNRGAIYFEPEKINNDKRFITAKKYLNSIFIVDGIFPEYFFLIDNVRLPEKEEIEHYNWMKDTSIHLIGKDI